MNENTEIKLLSDINESNSHLLDVYGKMAFAFWQLFKSNLLESGISKSTLLDKAKLKDWHRDFRLMVTKDERTKDEMIEVFNFLKVSDFWKPNIQSSKKLREQFERLYMEIHKNKSKNKNTQTELEMHLASKIQNLRHE